MIYALGKSKVEKDDGNILKDESDDSILLNNVLVKDVDTVFKDFIKLSQHISRFRLLYIYVYYFFIRLSIKDKSSLYLPTVFFIRRLFRGK